MLKPYTRLLTSILLCFLLPVISNANCIDDMSADPDHARPSLFWDRVREDKFIDLVIRNGIDFRPGDNVVVRADRDQKAMADVIAKELRERGAAKVERLYFPSTRESQAAMAAGLSPGEFAQSIYPAEIIQKITKEKYSSVVVLGANEMGLPEGAIEKLWTAYSSALADALSPFMALISTHEVPWTLVELPTRVQAKLVSPELGEEAAFIKLKEMVASVFQLQKDNPAESWAESNAVIDRRAAKLNALGIRRLHYEGPGTDFTVELHERARWQGGLHRKDNRVTQANFPAYETFVTPKFRSAQGRLQVQYPVEVEKELVEGAWFEFEDGVVIRYGATRGEKALTRFFELDERNRRLGEVALVDSDSPIAATGKLFYAIVYDENASSHVALGAGYADTFTSPHPGSEEDFAALEMNSVDVCGHIDFMIGSPKLNITAETYSGRKVPVMRNGEIILKD